MVCKPDPLTGKLSGNYEPVIPLIAPKMIYDELGLEWESEVQIKKKWF